ncbi:TonB-dependent receptor plug domain-containing protein [Bacteroides sp. K03]|uniref:TonB-dependent receptor plug domain-containing protein n=1 Tax=Bacteroides sp. K03 TaxID=2718928 RepID=UPI001C8B0F13|nr:TonB-dependent receptor plug domain-containing protein [Bacteroides sp. K03]MBX9189126.1 TonB-dependent receptor plug domain-containing protein [Bacteroides sp. K03]
MKNLLLFIFVLAFSWPVVAQNSNDTIVGRLVDAKGKAIRKALVSVKDVKAETDRYGIFQLNNVTLQDILTVILPKTEKEVQVSVNGIAYPNIVLGLEISVTEDKGEIMKLMLRSLRRSRSVSSTIVVTGEELVATGESNLFNALAGKVPGFTVVMKDNGDISAQLRGSTSISLDTSPLYLLDGTQVERLDNVNINDIKKVEISKDSNMYGAKGANGVIAVTLK